MSKDTFYFSHDSNSRNDDKILALRIKHGWEGYGLFWALIERLRESKDFMSVKDYNIIAFDLRTSPEKIKSIINDFGLFAFTEDGKSFYSERLLKSMELKNQKSEIAREKAMKRWNKNQQEYNSDAVAMQQQCNSNAIKVKESKVNKSKEYVLLEKEPKERESTRVGENFSQDDFSQENISSLNSEEEKKEKSCAKKEKKFTPPSIEDVKSYCEERQNGISAETFYNFYEAKGWMIGKNKMKDWKAAIRTWEQKRKEDGITNNQNRTNSTGSGTGYTTGSTNGKVTARQLLARELERATANNNNSENFTATTEIL